MLTIISLLLPHVVDGVYLDGVVSQCAPYHARGVVPLLVGNIYVYNFLSLCIKYSYKTLQTSNKEINISLCVDSLRERKNIGQFLSTVTPRI